MSLMKLSLLLGIVCVGLTVAVVFLSYSLYSCENNHDVWKYNVSSDSTTHSSLMSTTPSPAEPWLNYRLSPHLIPKLYEVKLEPDLKGSASFTCEEKILVQVTAPVDYIYVHIDRLNVTKSVVMQHNVQIPVKRSFAYPKHQYWVVQLERPLEKGLCSVEFHAAGSLRKQDIVGFYESTYKSLKGERSFPREAIEKVSAHIIPACF